MATIDKKYEAGRSSESAARLHRNGWRLGAWVVGALLSTIASVAGAQGYKQTNLVSDIPGQAQFTDPNLVNPWGMAFSPTSPIWVGDNHTGLATLYRGDGTTVPLVVSIPGPAASTSPGSPTGAIFNGSASFSADRFIFATEDGTIAGWQSGLGTHAATRVDNSASGAVYKGLAVASNAGSNVLYASNFHAGTIDAFNSIYSPASLGSFTDPGMPAGYAPFNIQNFGGNLYVTYALQDAQGHDDVPGAGNGYVDVFGTNGVFQSRLISQGVLNSPWGLAMAPGNFGQFSNDLLVGNFGDGRINAFNPVNGTFLGTLSDENNNPITIDGLWGLRFGNGAPGALTNSLYFTAGIPGTGSVEDHGLFGNLTPVPEPSSGALLCAGLIGVAFWRRKRSKQ